MRYKKQHDAHVQAWWDVRRQEFYTFMKREGLLWMCIA
jgi:hypothetical protein